MNPLCFLTKALVDKNNTLTMDTEQMDQLVAEFLSLWDKYATYLPGDCHSFSSYASVVKKWRAALQHVSPELLKTPQELKTCKELVELMAETIYTIEHLEDKYDFWYGVEQLYEYDEPDLQVCGRLLKQLSTITCCE
jgi:hypothetical protein